MRTTAYAAIFPTSRRVVVGDWACRSGFDVRRQLAARHDAPQAWGSLPAVGAVIDATSVSGISSGAYMAGQFQMAHAKLVTGAAIIAGGPYGCSESVFADAMPGPGTAFLNLSKAVNGCMLDLLGVWGVANPETLAAKAKSRAEKGEIDPISDVIRDRVYLFSGTSDRTVVPSIVKHAADFYAKLGVPDANIKFVNALPAGHAFVTDNEGGACDRSGEPYVVDCDYDQAGELLKHIYGPLNRARKMLKGDFSRPLISVNTRVGKCLTVWPKRALCICRSPAPMTAGAASTLRFTAAHKTRKALATLLSTNWVRAMGGNNKLIILFPQVATTVSNPQGMLGLVGLYRT